MENHPSAMFKEKQKEELRKNPNNLLTDVQVAEQMNISVQTLRNKRSNGAGDGIPYIKWNRCVRYLQSDVDAAIMACRIVPSN
ncbi:MAG: helix-turn-helix domain-containing protein [Desulfobacteraceae bacterium]